MLDRMQVGDVAQQAPHRSCAAPAASCGTRSASRATASTARTRSSITCAGRTLQRVAKAQHGWAAPDAADAERAAREAPLPDRRAVARSGGPQIDARIAAAVQRRLIAGVAFPTAEDPVYVADGDADQLVYVHEGGGTLRSLARRRRVRAGRLRVRAARAAAPLHPRRGDAALVLDRRCIGGARTSRSSGATRSASCAWTRRTAHRDFKRPQLARRRTTRASASWSCAARARWHGFTIEDSPLDVVGWDGTVYPWAFPILAFQPRGRAGAPAADVARHVRRARRADLQLRAAPVDFHPEAIPCPYPHSSVALRRDHLLLRGQLHVAQGRRPRQHLAPPDGRPARPAPGRLRGSIGAKRPTSSPSCSTRSAAAGDGRRARRRGSEYHASFGS